MPEEKNDVNKGKLPKELFQTFGELDKGNKLQSIKNSDVTLFSVLYNEKFGKWPEEYSQIDHNLKILYQDALREHKIDMMSKMTWKELMKNNLTTELKKLAPELYKERYFDYYGVSPAV
jgi:hypothetical protein